MSATTSGFDPQRLAALRSAVETGTFEAAARELRVTPSAISQRIKALENETGRVLLQRSKPVAPTESGEVLLRLARQLDALGREASSILGRVGAGSGSGAVADHARPALERLPIAVNADSLATWLLPAIAPLADEIAFELHRADETQTTELLRRGTVTAAITADPAPVQGCTSVLLGAIRYVPMASPGFAARWFEVPGETLTDALQHAPVVVFDRADTLQDRYLQAVGVDPGSPPCHYVPSSADFVAAIRLGFGWGLVPEPQLDDEPSLVRIDPRGWVDVPLFWQQWQLHTQALARTAATVSDAARLALRASV
ncbi:LysR family transcriptional regulator ArgP [Pseudoclavibacter sp. RFBA6]|uniref:LysR family transcriptional regulator ArgP n=1 Tax=Pseudoclavibacter sp. RFBA6 TaxID=2080573 RepID=UPI000CE904B0|nr:LysR family transcriptional regulator ArgP [Pseudoclavibacter sp. RFBA6]PPG43161.1 ArgP/LysG family DNA-binding transcriptional regulator [Pseudoclavibacter sp. RFBA6]